VEKFVGNRSADTETKLKLQWKLPEHNAGKVTATEAAKTYLVHLKPASFNVTASSITGLQGGRGGLQAQGFATEIGIAKAAPLIPVSSRTIQ
jgi:hypothetical protein